MFKLSRLFLPLFVMISMLFFTGCFSTSQNPSSPHSNDLNEAAVSGPVSFSIMLPETEVKSSVISESIRSVVANPTVTFKLIAVNVGNAGIPTHTFVKTAPVDVETGKAETTFSNIPAGTCIGEIHIEGGNINSYSDFHGVVDLIAAVPNTLYVVPKGSRMQMDFLAHVIKEITVSPALFAKALPNLTAQVTQAIANLDKSAENAFNEAVALFAKFVDVSIQVVTSTRTVTYNGNGNDAGSVPVDSNAYGPGDNAVVAQSGSLARANYHFVCWNTKADGSGTDYQAGSTLQMGSENIVLYAKWLEGTKISATALLPAVAATNIRAAAIATSKFKGFTMSLNGVELNAETEEGTTNGSYLVTFSQIVTAREYEAMTQGLIPVLIRTASARVIIATYLNTAGLTSTSPLAITVSENLGSSTGFSVISATIGSSVNPVATTNPASIQISASSGLKPTFTAVFSADIFGTDFATLPSGVTYDVDVREAGGTYRDVSLSDFAYSYNASTRTMTLALSGKTLTAGQTYEVIVRSIKVNGADKVSARYYTFTVASL